MKTQDPHAELQDGFEPAPAPLRGTPLRTHTPPRPTLCEAGPCRNYHRLETQVDAATPGTVLVPIRLPVGTPGAQEVPQGTAYTAPASFHVQVHHYCYPSPGIEMPLGDVPVVNCNRWDPGWTKPSDWEIRGGALRDYWDSPDGQGYRARLKQWEVARADEATKAAEVEKLIADSLAMATKES